MTALGSQLGHGLEGPFPALVNEPGLRAFGMSGLPQSVGEALPQEGLGTKAGHPEGMGSVGAEGVQEGCLPHPAAAVNHDELGPIRPPGPIQKGQFSFSIYEHVCLLVFVYAGLVYARLD
jgi:hypothetical protein